MEVPLRHLPGGTQEKHRTGSRPAGLWHYRLGDVSGIHLAQNAHLWATVNTTEKLRVPTYAVQCLDWLSDRQGLQKAAAGCSRNRSAKSPLHAARHLVPLLPAALHGDCHSAVWTRHSASNRSPLSHSAANTPATVIRLTESMLVCVCGVYGVIARSCM